MLSIAGGDTVPGFGVVGGGLPALVHGEGDWGRRVGIVIGLGEEGFAFTQRVLSHRFIIATWISASAFFLGYTHQYARSLLH